MKLKQLAIAISIIFSSQTVNAATYNLADEQQPNFSDSDLFSTQIGEPDNLIFDLKSPITQSKNIQLKKNYDEALALLTKRQFDAARNKITSLIKQNPDIAAFYNLQGLLDSFQKEYKAAIESFRKAFELDPKNLKAHLGLASSYIRSGNIAQAKKFANSGLSINDESPNVYILLAEIAYHENRVANSESLLQTALIKASGNTEKEVVIAGKLAKLYVMQKQPKKALKSAQDFEKRYPDNSQALALLANAQLFNQKPERAIPTIEKLISQESKDTRYRILLANLLVNQPDRKQQVVKLLDEASSIAPNDTQVQALKAALLTKLRLFSKALQTTKKVKQLAPKTGLAEILEAKIYLAEKKTNQALATFRKSYKLKPNPKVLNAITSIMLAQGKRPDAINFLLQELKREPKNVFAHFKLGDIYMQKKNISKAKKHYQAVLSEQPDNIVVLNNMALIYHHENNPQALKLAEKAYKLAPQSPDVADTYAVILNKQGDQQKALKVLQEAARLAPKNYDIQFHLAKSYALNGQKTQARQVLNTIIPMNNFSGKNAAISLLKKLQ